MNCVKFIRKRYGRLDCYVFEKYLRIYISKNLFIQKTFCIFTPRRDKPEK